MSNFYGSTQSRLKTYTADRRVEQRNGDIQQAKVYQQLAIERGDIETADRLAKLGMSVIKNIGASELPIVNKQGGVAKMSVVDHIKSMIEAGSLSNWWEAIKRIPPKKLSAKARIIQDDIKHNEMLKEVINEHLKKVMEMKYSGILPTARNESLARNEASIKEGISTLSGPNDYTTVIKDLINIISGGDEQTLAELDTQATASNAELSESLLFNKPKHTVAPSETDAGTLTFSELPTQILASDFNKYNAQDIRHLAGFFKDNESVKEAFTNTSKLKPIIRDLLTAQGIYYTQYK